MKDQNLELQKLNYQLEQLVDKQGALITERTSELEEANHQLQRLANLDGLTQIANRRQFDEYLHQQWQKLAQTQKSLSLVLCDVDYFKSYNDVYGHLAGDDCLRSLAQVMREAVTISEALVARYGGEEFAIILPSQEIETAVRVAVDVQFALKKRRIDHQGSHLSYYLTVSLGISSTIPQLEKSPAQLINSADRALYEAKKQGRDRFCAYV
ncbi:MAG: GGDEF domain-containing protein [Okeania sp. SIO2D1]|nr:GGDEF domain-containing protein [Okeania sp. SIO2D1]